MSTEPATTDSGQPALTLGEFRAQTQHLPDDVLIRPVHRDQVQPKDHEFLAYLVRTRTDPATGREDVLLIADYPPFTS